MGATAPAQLGSEGQPANPVRALPPSGAASAAKSVALAGIALPFGLLALLVFRRRSSPQRIHRALALYAALSASVALVGALWQGGWFAPEALRTLLPYCYLLLVILFVQLNRLFFQRERDGARWRVVGMLVWAMGAFWIVALLPFAGQLARWSDRFGRYLGTTLNQMGGATVAGPAPRFTLVGASGTSGELLLAGWLLFTGGSMLLTLWSYRESKQPLHRNRLIYWSLVQELTAISDLLLFGGWLVWGAGLRLLATLGAAYVILRHSLPDIHRLLIGVLSYASTALVVMLLYVFTMQQLPLRLPFLAGDATLWVGGVIVLLLALLFTPLRRLAHEGVTRLLPGSRYDARQLVRQYLQSINNVVDTRQLANLTIEFINETIGIQRGILFRVIPIQGEQGVRAFYLAEMNSPKDDRARTGLLHPGNPVVAHLRQQGHPLTQYAIDLLPDFQSIPWPERSWLAELGMDLYLPIHIQDEWAALIALGPKLSGERYSDDDVVMLSTLAHQTGVALEKARLYENLLDANRELVAAYDATLAGWSRALDLRDKETEGHTQRVTEMTVRLAQVMRLPEEEIVAIRRGALLHDIGKMGIPDGILLKNGPLTDEERRIMDRHPTYAYEMLKPISFLRSALDIPYCHHEKWDGTGYPRGLKGEEIPLAARLFSVVDVWDALRSDRPYRKGWSDDEVRAYLRQHAGTHFDPRVVELFLRMPWPSRENNQGALSG